MILTGSSASAGVAFNYLANAHMVQRLEGMKPIYDGFMPTSANQTIPAIDVATILVPTHVKHFRATEQCRRTATCPAASFGSSNLPAWRTSIQRRCCLLSGSVQNADQQIPHGGVHVCRSGLPVQMGR